MTGPPLSTRNMVTALLAIAGSVLLAVAALDWAGYSTFSISLVWR